VPKAGLVPRLARPRGLAGGRDQRCQHALTHKYQDDGPAWRMALSAGNLRLPIVTGTRRARFMALPDSGVQGMFDRIKTSAWLVGLSVVPVVLVLVVLPFGRRWA